MAVALAISIPAAAAEAAPGDLTFAACLGSLVGCPGVNPAGITSGVSAVAVSPGGSGLYIGGAGLSHLVFDGSGNLGFESCIGSVSGCTPPSVSGVLDGVHGIAVSADGKQLYAASWGGNAIAHFTLDAAGKPTFAGCIGKHTGCSVPAVPDAFEGLERVAVSADGKHLYAAAPFRPNPAPVFGGQAVSYFTLDAAGVPTFGGCVGARAGCTPVPSYAKALEGARNLVLSGDGKHLYVASGPGNLTDDSNTVSHFTLDAAGTPTFERCIGNHTGCIVPSPAGAVFAADGIGLNRDGTRLYVGANTGIAYFTIDGSGVPTYAGCVADLTGCAPTPTGLLFGAFDVELSPDGKHLYAAGYGSSAIVHFVLDAAGTPTLASCNGSRPGCAPTVPPAAGDYPLDLAVTPDGGRLYSAMQIAGVIDRFDIEQPPTPAPPAPPAPAPDRTPPTLSGSALSRTTFAAASKGASFVTAAATKRVKVGTTVRFILSEKATITFRVEKRGRTGRYKALKGSSARAAKQGRNSVRFNGRWRGRPLAPGRYRLVLTARDAAANTSRAKRLAFRIVKRARAA